MLALLCRSQFQFPFETLQVLFDQREKIFCPKLIDFGKMKANNKCNIQIV